MKKAIAVYIRVSTVGQNLSGQKAEIENWLAGNAAGREVQWFTDKATGNNLQRPGFQKLEQAIFNGEVDTVVIYSLADTYATAVDMQRLLRELPARALRSTYEFEDLGQFHIIH